MRAGRAASRSQREDNPYLHVNAVAISRPRPWGANLRIAQVCPLSESVPPKLYGGTERVAAFLTDQLVEAVTT